MRIALGAGVLWGASAPAAWALAAPQGSALGAAEIPAVMRPGVDVPKIESSGAAAAIRVDGRLDEPAWERAARLGPLTQTVPIEGAPMSVPTEVLLTYDQDNIYVGLHCYDAPKDIRARQMERDAFVRYDDVVELWFDPLDSGRFAYWYQVTPAGSLGDALISDNGTSFNKDWDGIWFGDVTMDDEGWHAELRIPIKTMSFDPAAPSWGFNLRRKRVANGEEGRWASPRIGYQFFQVSDGGRLRGIGGLSQGHGLDVTPYLKWAGDRADSSRSFGSEWDTGVTVRWRPSPATTLLVTTNTDFAETEVDARQVNLGRFPLFFPEKRDFFLEDAGAFEFGAPSSQGSLVPFFSRRVGRGDRGETVPILGGIKFTGRVGDWTVGALDTYVDSSSGGQAGAPGEVSEQNLGVVRVSRSLGDGQAIGAIVTTGDPGGESGRLTGGIDARFGSSDVFGPGHSGFLWAFALGTMGADDQADAGSFGIQTSTRSSEWQTQFSATRIEQDFAPALGFVRRSAVDQMDVFASRTFRYEDTSTLFRTTEVGIGAALERDLDGDEDSFELPIDLFEGTLWSQDAFGLELSRRRETIDDAFSVGNSATVVPGTYDENRAEVYFESNDRRLFGLAMGYEFGDYYGGTIERLEVEPVWIPNRYLTLASSFEDIQIDLAGDGTLSTQIYSLRFDVLFDPFTAWKSFIQYDTDSKNLSAQTRVRWIIEPGRELFIVGLFGFNKEDTRSSFTTGEQSLAVKLEANFRF